MNRTDIGWTIWTWNPLSGCDKCTEGCRFCYAEVIAEKFRGKSAFPDGFDLTLRPHKLREPSTVKEPTFIFGNSMSDWFWEQVPFEYVDKIVDVIEQTPHQYQVLTKRPERMLAYSRRRPLPPNFWAGVSVENQRNAGRVDVLRQVDAEIRFVSAEPLLGPLTLDLSGIAWLIVGGESGKQITDPSSRIGRNRALVEKVTGRWVPKAHAIEWVRSLRDQCLASNVKFFMKQWGGPLPTSGGRMLDGRTWDEGPRGLPEAVALGRIARRKRAIARRKRAIP